MIEAAGGLLTRVSPRGLEIAAIHRPKYNDWSLPKGKVLAGEDWERAAVREVKEETGLDARTVRFADALTYLVHGSPKVVLFWVMVLEGSGDSRPNQETDEFAWLTPEEALTKLSYPRERNLVQTQFLPSRVRRSFLWRLRKGVGSLSLEWTAYMRLQRAFREGRLGLNNIVERCKERNIPTSPWGETAEQLLRETDLAIADHDVDGGFRYLKAALRMELFGLEAVDVAAFRARAADIASEAEGKLASWRKEAVDARLKESGKVKAALSAEEVIGALKIIDDHSDNLYYKLRTIRRQLSILGVFALGAALVWIPLAPLVLGTSLALVVAVAGFGVLGASVSGLLSIAKTASGKRIPEVLATWSTVVARVVVGMGSALALQAFLVAGLLNIGSISTGLILAVAFAGGFSERLVTRAVESIQV